MRKLFYGNGSLDLKDIAVCYDKFTWYHTVRINYQCMTVFLTLNGSI